MSDYKNRTVVPSVDVLSEVEEIPSRYQCEHVGKTGRCSGPSLFVMLTRRGKKQTCFMHYKRIKQKEIVSMPSGAEIPSRIRIRMIAAASERMKRLEMIRRLDV